MNTLFIKKWVICLPSILFLITGCVKDDNSDCRKSCQMVIQVLDGYNNDITETDVVDDVVLYLFGSESKYMDSIPIPTQSVRSRTPITINYPEHSHITAVVWCNTEGDNTIVDDVKEGDSLTTPLDINLNMEGTSGQNEIYSSPEDLFHGYKRIDMEDGGGSFTTELKVKRKISSIIVIAKHLKDWAGGGSDDEYYILVHGTRKIYSLVDGKLGEDDAIHRPDVSFDDNDYLVSSLFNTFPSGPDQRVEVEIFKGDNRIYRASLDQNGNPFVAEEGRTLQVEIDFSGSISVNVSVNPWHVINQYSEL
ncbi:hypothetical protein D0T84_07855 [Dysgonomonas sp. 521]|uniref:FimB/Mfa2 family fimbrial subunit n=1 Tax=Dysgonomonas sp. 521 TaxID=2302932 RepID=UPI0013D2A84A|nr:FimB/Mfa2 family fimbrial subunit [Dysgonomonas sp. 521]NDV94832.1 hypothetical protein [Dysgonomonas sp. 521]